MFGQRYDSAGQALGSEFRVNSFTAQGQATPSVASGSTGNFVVVWRSADGSGDGIFGQRYDDEGFAQGGEFRVNSITSFTQTPSVASDVNGDFVVVTSGSFTWTVSGPPSASARARVSWTDDPGVSDSSDTMFRIKPPEP